MWVVLEGVHFECARQYTNSPRRFEDWLLKFDNQAAPAWCLKYVNERSLASVQSNQAVFRITTPTVTVRLDVGVNHHGDDDEVGSSGRVLPDLFFWQMDVGFEGRVLEHESLSGLFGETVRPVLDDTGLKVMDGQDAFRGTVEDHRVSDALGDDFPPSSPVERFRPKGNMVSRSCALSRICTHCRPMAANVLDEVQ